MLAYGVVALAVISLTGAVIIRYENSLNGPYIAGGANLIHWHFGGDTQLSDGYVRLTPDENDKEGSIWNSFPTISNSWEFQVHFRIHGKGVNLNGDGLALWYVKEDDMLHDGPVFGSKNYFTGLGVFVDTFQNQDEPHKHRHPFISAMVNNGSLHYEHDEDGTATQIGGCHAAVRNMDVPTRIAVSYIKDVLAVYVDNEGLGQWRLCFRREKVHLPTGYYFGISASTSEVSDSHDIISVTGLNLDPDSKEWIDRTDIIPEVEDLHIPLEYNKDFVDGELQEVEKKYAADDYDDVETEAKRKEETVRKEERKETARKEERKGEGKVRETRETKSEESPPPPTPLLRKLIYVTGAIVIILVLISCARKYNERRRERIQKRMY